MKRLVAALVSAAAALAVSGAWSAPTRRPASVVHVVSMGSPNEGKLQGGQAVTERPYLRFLPGHHRHWGTPQLVGMLERGAQRVRQRYPGSVVELGDLSQRGGGDVSGHHSHESGRDADVSFLMMNAAGKPVAPGRLVAFDEEGRGAGRLRFDDARNWAMIESWLTDPQARVVQIFVAAHLRDRLLAYARAHGAAPSVRNRAAFALLQPTRGLPHDNHFHVRVACPPGQNGACIEFATRPHAPASKKGHVVTASKVKHHGAAHGNRGGAHGGRATTTTPALSAATPAARHTSRPVVGRARKRVGTSGEAAPSLVLVVPAPDDI